MLNGLTIRTRLQLTFGAILMLLLAVAAIGINRMALINEGLHTITAENNPELQHAAQMLTAQYQITVHCRNFMLMTDMAKIQHESDVFKGTLQRIESERDALAAMFAASRRTTQGEKDLLGAVSAMLPKIRPLQEQLESQALAGKGPDFYKTFSASPLAKMGSEMRENIERLVALKQKLNDDAAAEAEHTYGAARAVMISLAVGAVALWAGMAFWMTRSITRPINSAVEVATRLAAGDLTVTIDSSSRDEVGLLLRAMREMADRLSEVIGKVRSATDSISSASEEVAVTAQSLSQSATEQSSSVEETSASIEQMNASISQNAENAKTTNHMATNAAAEANDGGDAVGKTTEAMKQIAKKISIIDDIAYQTNLLALNAAIEAARAGEHGKGFAVVAAEVRKLAERSQVAAEEIGELASSSVELAEKAGRLLESMVPSITKTADLVQEIAAASQEQSTGVGQINTAMNQLSMLTQQNASASEELAATSQEMSGQAQKLQQTMGFFKVREGKTTHEETAVLARAPKRAGSKRIMAFARPAAKLDAKAAVVNLAS